jgi:hypothetical protein
VNFSFNFSVNCGQFFSFIILQETQMKPKSTKFCTPSQGLPTFQLPPQPLANNKGTYMYEPMHENAIRALIKQGLTAGKMKERLGWNMPTAVLNNKVNSMKRKMEKESNREDFGELTEDFFVQLV